MNGVQEGAPPDEPKRKKKKKRDHEYVPDVQWHTLKVYFINNTDRIYVVTEVVAEMVVSEFRSGEGDPIQFEHTSGFTAVSPEFITQIEAEVLKGQA